MNARLAAVATVFLWTTIPVSAHRLDEYLQATTLALEKDQVTVQMRLTPGVEVIRAVLADIDTDGDGAISEAEQRAYAERVLHDVTLTMNGDLLPLRLVSTVFPKIEEMREGLGDILLRFEADLAGSGPDRKLVFENRHEVKISVYLVNCLVPGDPSIRVIAQNRNPVQSFYQLDYTQTPSDSSPHR